MGEQTIVDLLRTRAALAPEDQAYTFLSDRELPPHSITYCDLEKRSRAVGGRLQSLALEGQPVLLLYPAGLEFVAAFLGCLYARAIAIPCNPPRSRRENKRLQGILAASGCAAGLTTSSKKKHLDADSYSSLDGAPIHWMATDEVEAGFSDDWRDPNAKAETIAYLQYTSGSTSEPKGVVVTHGNVLANLGYIDDGFQHDRNSILVSWLPHFHDMGLVYGVLQPLYNQFRAVLMSPLSFIQRPYRWLHAISDHHATHSGGPNFAYDLCVRAIPPEQRTTLDLTNWRVAFNGAEQVRAETLEQFAETFAGCGFARSSFCPAYGLAEATLKVSAASVAEDPVIRTFDAGALEANRVIEAGPTTVRRARLVGCGCPSSGARVVIVDPKLLTACDGRQVGEIWVSGPGVARGYWRRPDETAQYFRTGEQDTGPILRTGDLGFLHEGQLFVAGRCKDMLIIRGHNYYPDDLEATFLGSSEELRPGCGAAFAIEAGKEEHLAVVAELHRTCRKPDVEMIAAAIRRSLYQEHQLYAHVVALVKVGGIPRTSSGKIQRQDCKTSFLNGRLHTIAISAPASTPIRNELVSKPSLAAIAPGERGAVLEVYLMDCLAGLRGLPCTGLDVSSPLVSLGVDSLVAAQLKDLIERDWRVILPFAELMEGITIREIAARIISEFGKGGSAPDHASQQLEEPPSEVADGVPLSQEQERLWLLEEMSPGSLLYQIPAAIAIRGELGFSIVRQSLAEVSRRHEPLRSNFHTRARRPVQCITAAPVPVGLVDLQHIDGELRDRAARRVARDAAKSSFHLGRDRLLRVVMVRIEADLHWLVMVAHHIVFDGTSLEVLLRELTVLADAFASGRESPLPNPRIPYRMAVAGQCGDSDGPEFAGHVRYWEHQLAPARRAMRIPADDSPRRTPRHHAGRIDFELPLELSHAVDEFSRAWKVSPFLVLLTAYVALLARWIGERHITVGTPIHGRTSPEAWDLIGLFAHPLPLCLEIAPGDGMRDVLRHVQSRVLEAHTHAATPFAKIVEIVRPERGSANPLFQVMFSFLRDPLARVVWPGRELDVLPISTGRSEFPLWLTLVRQAAGKIYGYLTFQTRRFGSATARRITDAYLSVLSTWIERPDLPVSALHIVGLPGRAPAPEPVQQGVVAIAATFTANGLEKPIDFWLGFWSLPLSVQFAPYHQVFQQLLDPKGLLRSNEGGINVLVVRLEDFVQNGDQANGSAASADPAELARCAREFAASLEQAVSSSGATYVVCLCPASPGRADCVDIARAEQRLLVDLQEIDGLHVVTTSDVQALYRVSNVHDPYAERLSRTPYTDLYFTALGTLLARRIYSLRVKPYKVIVLDCDDTLWTGACGEGDGAVEMDAARTYLQEFMVRQRDAGTLLCLCSKNLEVDVFQVFERHTGMPLQPHHLVAWRINRLSKSENLKSLARELQLDLESFIFVDDSPLECAEVQANCPAVLTIQLPAPDRIPAFLNHVWAFDHLWTTAADSRRSDYYARNRLREAARRSAPSLADFLRGLEIRTRISRPGPADWPRVTQLIQRTNQFNLTGIRRTESEIRSLCQSGALECLVAEVSDRFGDYGLVGAMLYSREADRLEVDTFVLSCRALGRRVEHAMLAELAAVAQATGLNRVGIRYCPTSRNGAAWEFLQEVAGEPERVGAHDSVYSIPTAAATESAVTGAV